jgi:hypothetical protein
MAKPLTALARTPDTERDRRRDGDRRAQVRLAWCLAVSNGLSLDEAAVRVSRDTGVSAATVEMWRTERQPDGQDWEQFRVELSLANHDAQIALLASGDEVQMHVETVRVAQRLLGAVSSAISEGVLYSGPLPKKGEEDFREVVTCLWDAEGKVVPLGTMRPKSAGEAARMIGVLSDARQNALERVEKLLGATQDARAIQQAVLLTVREVVVELWGEDAAVELWEAFAAHQAAEDGVPTVKPESAEDVDDDE